MARIDRISSLLKREISDILLKKVSDHRIGFVSITGIKISKDLSQALIYYSQIGNESERKKTYRGLCSASKFIQGEIGKVIRLQTIPHLKFVYDDSLEKGSRTLEKLNMLANEKS